MESSAADKTRDFLTGGGEMAGLIAAKNWAETPLGPIETWPQSLRTTVSLCLASNFPINIVWGPQNTQIYNDGYRVVCGEGHPAFLGMDYAVSWASAWPAIGEPFARAKAGATSYLENQRMFLHRNGYLEETFFTFSHSPIRDESGGIGGLFHPVTETTATMLGARRTRAIRDLTARLGGAKTVAEVFDFAAETMEAFAFDLPFAVIYRRHQDDRGTRYRLAASMGAEGTEHRPAWLGTDDVQPWPVRELLAAQAPIAVAGVAALFGPGKCGPYEEPPDVAIGLPIGLPGAEMPAALMFAGISPRLPQNDVYLGFYDLLAAAIGAALANAQAYEAEKQRAEALAAIDRAKTAFFSNVSHEFRTPLTLMLGPIEDALADSAGLPSQQRERLEVAHRNALRLLKLVNTLLDFSRIEAGRAQAFFEPVELSTLTAELASNFRSACERAGLAFTVDCPLGGAIVHVDRDMWEKIVLNLVSNAFKFTLEGGIVVSLREIDGQAELRVCDTGVGIPDADLPKVFERFHRVGGQAGRTHEGTGIGLALVDELVRLHGGRIELTSVVGKGTTFRVRVPIGNGHLSQITFHPPGGLPATAVRASVHVEEALRWLPDEPDDMVQPPAEAPAASGEPRIVVADDNSDMRSYVTRILRAGGYQVEPVCDGFAALEAVRRAPPALVLTDVMMPRLDGFGLLHALRAEPGLHDLPVILLSARAGEEARVEGLAAGADDYLVKPFGARELRARIDGAVSLSRQRKDAAFRERDLRAEIVVERARAALRETENRLHFALEAGMLGSWELDLLSGTFIASPTSQENLGLTPSEHPVPYDDVLSRIHRADRLRQAAEVERALTDRLPFDVEYRVQVPEGDFRWVQIRGRGVYDEAGNAIRITGVSLDVTTRKRAEMRQKLLLDELNHRVKNTLATVQAIAMQTQRGTDDHSVFVRNLDGRIGALARAHDLLTEGAWEGTSLADLVARTVTAYESGDAVAPRVRIHGPLVTLSPNAAVTLNMAFHELATNAAKYGALSVPNGRVAVEWQAGGDGSAVYVDIAWREEGGPLVRPPTRRGFGSRLLERGLAGELGGEVKLDFQAAGIRCCFRLPLSSKIGLGA